MTGWGIEVGTSPGDAPNDPKAAREASVLAEVGGDVLPLQAMPAALVTDGAALHYRGVRRVPLAMPINAVLDAVEARLGDRSYYKIFVHRCHHDTGGPCEPRVTRRTFGNIPEGV